jgi:hypothetical protein
MQSTVISMGVVRQAALPVEPKRSNRQRGGSTRRALSPKHTQSLTDKVLRSAAAGDGSQRIRVALRTGVIDNRGNPKSLSRLPKQWSDMVREPAPKAIEYAPEYWLGLVARGLRFNPNPTMIDQSKVKFREFSERLGKVITKTKTVYHGGYRKAPAPELVWRGAPCLFDDCQAIEGKREYGKKLHACVGTLPPYPVPLPKPRDAWLDALVADWRGRQQLAYLEQLGVEL